MSDDVALGLIESLSIAQGMVITDAVAKKAQVRILESAPICSGKFVLLFSGLVGPVEHSYQAGIEAGGHHVVDDLFLAQVHDQVIPAVLGTAVVERVDALGVIETFSVASCVLAADAAVKAADVQLMEIRLARGLGGKGFFTLTGEQTEVEASLNAGQEAIRGRGMLCNQVIIPRPHPDLDWLSFRVRRVL
ncbi:MAG: BMC domain-containing protein [Proteobacteria bacterium]|nr:BMC domain-containing protein [Pseudomonadota bacterium]